jgi:hypothetical protein
MIALDASNRASGPSGDRVISSFGGRAIRRVTWLLPPRKAPRIAGNAMLARHLPLMVPLKIVPVI